jgi:exodeoxyribonuclease X
MVVRVIDIETTGTDPECDAVIEIASVDVLADGSITNRVSTLVRPGISVPPEASAVHHLIDEDLSGAPPLMDARLRAPDRTAAGWLPHCWAGRPALCATP